jgi:hypothetical protein
VTETSAELRRQAAAHRRDGFHNAARALEYRATMIERGELPPSAVEWVSVQRDVSPRQWKRHRELTEQHARRSLRVEWVRYLHDAGLRPLGWPPIVVDETGGFVVLRIEGEAVPE